MPGTWAEVQQALGWRNVSPFHPGASAYAAGWYMRRMRSIWRAERPEADRRDLALASYNAGPGSIIRAQAECQDARHWPDIAPCLPAITGRHAAETTGYVERIARWYGALTCSAGY